MSKGPFAQDAAPSHPRILLIAPHFAEYSLRLAGGLSEVVDVDLGLNLHNLAAEVDPLWGDLAPGVRRFGFGTHSRVARLMACARIVWRCLRFRPQLVHFQESGNALTGDLAPLLGRFMPVALTVHDPLPHQGRDSELVRRRARRRRAVRGKAAVIFVHGAYCTAQMRTAEAGGGAAPIMSIPHGAILGSTNPIPHDVGARRLLFFGRMEAYKGLEVLLDAADLLEARGVAFHLTLAGSGPELDRLRPRLDQRANIRVRDGWLDPSVVMDEIQAASLIVAPYLEATQSGVVAAAFSNGRPVAASAVGGLPEVIEDGKTGVLVPPRDPKALADALQRLLGDPAQLKRLGEAALAHAQTALNWNPIADVHAQAYRDAIERWNAVRKRR